MRNMASVEEKFQTLFEHGGLNAVLRRLTSRQRLFVEEYSIEYDEKKALEKAGYSASEGTRSNVKSRLVAHPGVAIALREFAKQKQAKMAVDAAYVTHKWLRVIENMEKKPDDPKAVASLLRASELLAKSLGMFVEKTEITGKNGDAIKIEETKNAADAFASSIASLASRAGKTGGTSETKH